MHREIIKDIGEKELIKRISEYMPANQASDDCAFVKTKRDDLLIPLTNFTPAKSSDVIEEISVRFRTVGDITCTCPVESNASSPEEILYETALTQISERGATRLDDQTNDSSMEKRKKQGYF